MYLNLCRNPLPKNVSNHKEKISVMRESLILSSLLLPKAQDFIFYNLICKIILCPQQIQLEYLLA
jgi:hypothetical protein